MTHTIICSSLMFDPLKPSLCKQDIVVPFMAMSSHDRFLIETPLRPGALQRPRNLTFFFSGGICGSGRYNAVPPNCNYYKQQRYSGGVRQTVRCRVRGWVGEVCGAQRSKVMRPEAWTGEPSSRLSESRRCA